MKRLTASALSLALVLGAFPAEAQVVLGRSTLGATLSAPAPVPAGLASVSAFPLSAPAALAPSLTPSLAAAPAAPNPLVAAAALAVAAAPLKAAPVAFAAAPAPIEALRTAAAPKIGGLAFDGAARLAASAPDPVDPGPRAESPKKSWLQRYKDSRKNTPPYQTAFAKGMAAAATTLAVAAPAVLLMAPAMKAGYALPAAYALLIFVGLIPMTIGAWAIKKFRKSPAAARPPTRSRLLATAVLGAMFGLGLGVTPYMATGPVAQHVEMYLDRSRPAADQEHVRWIRGGAIEDEVVKAMSANPIGRDTLKKLEDRFGVLRLPTFFVSKQDDSYAEHENFYDGVYLNETEILGRGWTVDQFLKDPALQRRLVREMDSTIVHELTHAVQGRRLPWRPSYFKNSVESEQEAFFQEMLYRLAALEADPKATNNGHDQWMIPDAADDFDGFLKSVQEMYEKNVVVGTDPDYNAYFAAQRARWPAFRVHVYQVLAARSQPGMAKIYTEKARKAAIEAGLPEPSPSLAGR